MISDIFISPAINNKDIESLLESVSFPSTKAEIIHKAEAKGVPPHLLGLLRNFPSRFYRSKDEVISHYVSRSMRYSRIDFNNGMETFVTK
jgi:hypothetical protein